ncbi:MAG: hypothetical protein M3Y53_13105 [Thermoproteota archaeon]|nr:hypothetical protein [Thermoproteota archaeon]
MASTKNGPPKPELPSGPPAEQSSRILELNKAGNSTREISRITKTPRTTVQRLLDRLSQDPNNGVKDNSRNAIEEGKWFKIIEHVRDIDLPFYEEELSVKPTLREILYRLEELGILSKTEYGTLKKYTVRARKFSIYYPPGYENYPKLLVDCFEDETRFLLGYHNELPPEDWIGFVKRQLAHIDSDIANYDGKGTPGVNPGHWFRAKHYVEVWLEKLALAKVFLNILNGRDVYLAINRGYSSLTFIYKNCERLKEFAATHPGVKIHVRYFGDRDPSGSDMDRYLKESLKFFGLRVDAKEDHPDDIVDFKRAAITEEQIKKYQLPTAPKDEEAEERFDRDSRSEKYTESNGRAVTELESMLASKEKINAFRIIVTGSVDEFWNKDDYLKNCLDGKIKEYSEDELKDVRDKMYQGINDAFVTPWKTRMVDNMMINDLLSMLGLHSDWVICAILRLAQ